MSFEFFDLQILAGCITIFIIVVGVFGNLLTIVALSKYPRVRNVTAAFIISLCVADGIFCAAVLPFHAMRFFRSKIWQSNPFLCNAIPFLQYGNVGISLLFIAMITINRYVMIAHHTMYSRIYKPINVVAMVIFCIIFSFGMQLPTLFGIWGKYQYHSTLGTCSISEDERGHSSKVVLFAMGFVVPCVIIICCYTRIFWVVHSSEMKMTQHALRTSNNNTDTGKSRETKRKRNEWRVTKMVLAIFLSFLICYLPITIVKIVDRKVECLSWHIISYVMLFMSACINPIIYVIMNKQYRKAYGNVLRCRAAQFFTPSSGNSLPL